MPFFVAPTGNPRGRPPKKQPVASKASPQETLLAKFQGPFVHVEGGMRNPSFSNVINGPLDQISAAVSLSLYFFLLGQYDICFWVYPTGNLSSTSLIS
jgi:hypothetical protein